MKVLSCFDGISCGQQALKNIGITPSHYTSLEIDKYAIAITNKNFPKTRQFGSIKGFSGEGFLCNRVDLMLGGFCCQPFSMAGKRKGFSDERGGLFFDLIRLRDKIKPKFFLFENVRMKKEHQYAITKLIGVEPIEINSSLLTAQNRKRLYWVGSLQSDGTYKKVEIEQPQDKGVVLKDILENGLVDRDKSYCLDANYFKGGNLKSYFEKHRRQLVFSKDGLCHIGDADLKGKSPTLTTMGGGHREPKIICGRSVNRRLNKNGKREDYNKDIPLQSVLEPRKDLKTGTLTTVQKDNVLLKGNRFYRKLTPIECERLQGMPYNFTEKGILNIKGVPTEKNISNSQRYKALGNGFTVPVIEHLLKNIVKKQGG